MSPASPRSAPAGSADPADPADWLSAAVDGDASALDRACRALREGDERTRAATREAWHTYHLIGDVLRSSELASAPRRDADFLAGFRERLAAEPVVLAPVAAPRAARWRVPAAAVASMAGVAVVAGVLVMSRGGGDAAAPLAAAPAVPAAGGTTVVRDGYVRDARLEEFIRVHQGAAGGLLLQPQGVRQVDVVVVPAPQR
jgi:sigma-E factor negative regulatory protein RseA